MTKPDMHDAGPAFVVETLKKRADFLKAAKGKRQHMPGFVVQARKRGAQEPNDMVRIGYTCSKKVGNAVARNRAKRRLREIAQAVLPEHGLSDYDYVLIGRASETAARNFTEMKADLIRALSVLHPK